MKELRLSWEADDLDEKPRVIWRLTAMRPVEGSKRRQKLIRVTTYFRLKSEATTEAVRLESLGCRQIVLTRYHP